MLTKADIEYVKLYMEKGRGGFRSPVLDRLMATLELLYQELDKAYDMLDELDVPVPDKGIDLLEKLDEAFE